MAGNQTVTRRKSARRKKRAGFFGFKTFVAGAAGCGRALSVRAIRRHTRKTGGSLPGIAVNAPASAPQGSWEASIFFGDPDTDFLIPEKRTLSWDRDPYKRRLLMTELLRGPTGAAVRTTPSATVLRSVSIMSDGLANADFSAQLASEHPGGSSSELLTVYSIVNTLVFNIEDIKRVQILIEGQTIDTIAGHMDCRQPRAIQSEC